MKKSLAPLVVALSLAGVAVLPQTGLAESQTQRIQRELNDIRNQKNAAAQKAASAEKQIDQVQHEKQQTESDIAAILGQIDETNGRLNLLNDQIYEVKTTLEDNAVQLQDAEERVASRDQLLRSRVRLMYMNGAVTYADVLLSSTSFSDFLSRLDALKSIVNQDKEILESNKRDRTTIAEKRVAIEQQLAEVKTLYGQAAAIKADLEVKEKEKQVRIASLDQQEHALEDITEEAEKQLMAMASKESAKLQALQSARAAEEAKKRKTTKADSGVLAAPSVYYKGTGQFQYPLPQAGRITSLFGKRVDPITGRDASHNGMDIAVPAGTDILAADDGTVILASWWSGYGNCVIIDHGDGLWSLYGHIRNNGTVVEKGDRVKKGQKIAEVGSTGRSTGNHLHFEVRKNEVTVDPRRYLP